MDKSDDNYSFYNKNRGNRTTFDSVNDLHVSNRDSI